MDDSPASRCECVGYDPSVNRKPMAWAEAALLLVALDGCRREETAPAAKVATEPSVELADGPRRPAPQSRLPRVIWCGLDGADLEYLGSLASQGKMPNWKRLSEE